MKISKILLMGKGGEYLVAKKDKEGLELVPGSKKVFARELVQYGFDFTFGGSFEDKNYGIYGYGYPHYKNELENETIKESNGKKDYGRINLDRTIKGLEKDVKDAGADYVLVDKFYSKDNTTSWEISGKAKLLIKR